MLAAGEDSAGTGVLPGTGSRSVLLEAADSVLAGRCAALLWQAGFHMSRCAGGSPQAGGPGNARMMHLLRDLGFRRAAWEPGW